MYNFIIPCSPSHVIVPKYCHVGASLSSFSIDTRQKEYFSSIILNTGKIMCITWYLGGAPYSGGALKPHRRASMSQYFDNLIWDTFL